MTSHNAYPGGDNAENEDSLEKSPALRLMEYIHGMFGKALRTDAQAHDLRQQSGFFTQEEPLPLGDDLTAETRRIVLDRPYPHRSETVWEAFVPINQIERTGRRYTTSGKVYIRRVIDGVSEPLEFLDETGLTPVGGQEASFEDVESLMLLLDQANPMERAQEVLKDISERNIIPFND